jgi:predicted  nucleic acid-binding Zn-ribbon protein
MFQGEPGQIMESGVWEWVAAGLASVLLAVVAVLGRAYRSHVTREEATDIARNHSPWMLDKAKVEDQLIKIQEEIVRMRDRNHLNDNLVHEVIGKIELMKQLHGEAGSNLHHRLDELREQLRRVEDRK